MVVVVVVDDIAFDNDDDDDDDDDEDEEDRIGVARTLIVGIVRNNSGISTAVAAADAQSFIFTFRYKRK